ncbi:MAG: leucine-rich repeat protein [Prevotella sp.]|nr:leucine-rich repeat protein [Prevotella sp.]
MKRTLLFIAFVLTSLTMSAQGDLTVGDIQNSGCLNKTQEEKIPTIVLTKEGSVLSVQLLNYESYTATTDFNVTSSISNDDPCSVTISVTPVIPEGAQVEWEWVCLFNVSFTIHDFELNRFYLDCWWCKGLIELKDGEPMMLEKKVEDVTIDGISFSLLKALHKAMLVDWTTTEEDLHIPSKVNYENEDYTVTCISKDAFWNANQATKITVPKTVRSMNLFSDNAIYANPFRECKSLKWIEVEDGCPLFSSIDGVLFAENKTMLLGYPIASTRTTYTVPKGVTKIRSGAFHHNKYLRKLMIREEVTDLGWHLFSDTQSLEELYIRGIIDPSCMSDLFGGMDTKVAVYVQQSEVEKYKAVYKGPVSPLPWAQDDSDYLPFVELGKQWHVTNTDSYPYNRLYCFSMHKEVERNGKTYVHTCYADDEQDNHYHELLREENKRVYKYNEWEEKEYLVYDFSLKEGDTFTYELMTHYPVEWKVLKQGWLEDGPDIVSSCTSNPDGTLDIKYRKLRTWTVGPKNEESGEYNEMATWVECVGALKGMFAQYSTGGSYRLAYVERAEEMGAYWENNIYLPFSFYYDNYLFEGTRVHGCNLPTGKAELSEDSNHQLTYELEGDRLHVYGKVLTHGGPNNYAYFFEETTDDNSVRKLHFNIIEIEPLPDPKPGSDGMLLHATDFYVPGFDPNLNYYVIDNRGVEHPVINKTPQMAYRPFVEDDKVWAVKVFDDGMPTRQWIDYYYFDGDTIVNGLNAKRMLVASEQDTSGKYVGAWYEQDKKVYFAYDQQQQFELLYDFTLSTGDTTYEDEYMMYVVNKMSGGIPGFKGTYYVFLHNGDVMNRWLEGVGSESYPYINTMIGLVGRTGVLLVCKVGDEIIYYNSEEEDPYSMGAKKHRFDFTHTIKTKPKAPSKREKSDARINSSEREVARPKVKTRGEEEEQSLYGEYNNLLLGINLEPLDEAYLVRITNESGQVVYEKDVNAGSIVGLNIDISAFAKGRYTVTMENSSEVFTGEFETITTGIQELINEKETKNFNSSTLQFFNSIYNLQGQRLNTLQKGLNIVNGRKVLVK